jgi:hypothetical protein
MTAAAKGDEVLFAVIAAFRQRSFVMHLLGLHQQALLVAQLTHGVLLHVFVSDALPRSTVATLDCWVPVIFLIAPVLLLLMLRAEATLRQVGATGEGAGAFGLVGHCAPPFGHQKSHRRLLYDGSSGFSSRFAIVIISDGTSVIQ